MNFVVTLLSLLMFCASMSAQIITTVAGTGEPGFSGDGGPAVSALLNDPRHLAVDAAGNVYLVDTNNVRIRRISPDGRVVTVAGNGEAAEPAKGPAVRSGFLGIGGLAVMENGTLYIADATGLQKVAPSGVLSFVVTGQSVQGVAVGGSTVYLVGVTDVSLLGANGAGNRIAGSDLGDTGDGGPAAKAKFFASQAAVDPAGNIYVVDKEAQRVRRFAPRGAISTFAGNGTAGFGGDGGPASQSQLNRPESIAIDVAGNVYIADTGNFRVRRVAADGVITTLAGNGESNRAGDGGPARRASLGSVFDVAVGCAGVFVTDIQSVRKIALTAPLIAYNGVLDSTGKAAITAGRPFSISGCNLADSSLSADATRPLPQTLAGASVTVNGVVATLSSVAPGRILGIAPSEVGTGPLKVIVSVNGTASAPLVVTAK